MDDWNPIASGMLGMMSPRPQDAPRPLPAAVAQTQDPWNRTAQALERIADSLETLTSLITEAKREADGQT